MRFNIDKVATWLFIFLLGFMNLGMIVGVTLLLNHQGTVKSQLFEIAIMILVIVFVNFLVLTAFCGDENG